MSSLLKIRRAGRKSRFRGEKPLAGAELCVPKPFLCPISLELMRDPVTLSTGVTYDRQSIETWLDMGKGTCPVTNRAAALDRDSDLVPNHALRRMIQDWCIAHRDHGVDRIPTPRIPVTAADAAQMLSEIASAARHEEGPRCRDVVGRIRTLGQESERNRRCIAANGAAVVLSAAFCAFSSAAEGNQSTETMEEILAALPAMFPLDKEACARLAMPSSLRSIERFARSGKLAARLNAVVILREIVYEDRSLVDVVFNTDGMVEALVKLIREPISPQATKASLAAIFYMVSADEKAAERFVGMGVVPLLVEILVDSENSMAEKALGVLDGICSCKKGRRAAYDHALTTPVLVKKIFRVSSMATDFAVSALWKLCKSQRSASEETAALGGAAWCRVEALQSGAFQKLLLLLQVGCSGASKEKTSHLLKLLNATRCRVDCVEPAYFGGLKMLS